MGTQITFIIIFFQTNLQLILESMPILILQVMTSTAMILQIIVETKLNFGTIHFGHFCLKWKFHSKTNPLLRWKEWIMLTNLLMQITMITIDLSVFWIAVSWFHEIFLVRVNFKFFQAVFLISLSAIWGSTCPWPVNVENSSKFWPGFGSAVT